jgi:Glycosyl transferase family 2
MNHFEGNPEFSVIIASWLGKDATSRCLASLLPQCAGSEVVVATNRPVEVAAALEKRHPDVRFLSGRRDASVFELRSLGVRQARGKIIALLEDHTTVGPRWVESLRAAHAQGCHVAGGPVENGLTARAYDAALYLCEYGIYMPGLPAGKTKTLSGINVAYDCNALVRCREIWEKAFYETNVHAALQDAGHDLHLVPDAWVRSHLSMSWSEAMRHLFDGGRYFGGFRMARATGPGRVFWRLAWPAVPLVLLGRLFRLAATRRRTHLWDFFRALPHLALLLGAWAAGEGAGCLPTGTEGHAHRR